MNIYLLFSCCVFFYFFLRICHAGRSLGSSLSHWELPPQQASPLLEAVERSGRYRSLVSQELPPSDNLSSRHSSRVASCCSPAVLGLLGRLDASEPAELFSKWHTDSGRTAGRFSCSLFFPTVKKNLLGNHTREQKGPVEMNSSSLLEGETILRCTRLLRSLLVFCLFLFFIPVST